MLPSSPIARHAAPVPPVSRASLPLPLLLSVALAATLALALVLALGGLVASAGPDLGGRSGHDGPRAAPFRWFQPARGLA
ncbi:MAG: hypothetical protein U0869_25685 [Chloroflexota bacterium]